MEIYFQNIKNRFIKKKIEQVYHIAFKELELNEGIFSITINFVLPEEIKDLNLQFRKMDKVTDVLSFPNLEFCEGKRNISSEDVSINDGLVNLGDIAICKEVAKAQAREYCHSYKREVCFLALHGLLHLLGFDHMKKTEAKKMEKLADAILTKAKVTRNAK